MARFVPLPSRQSNQASRSKTLLRILLKVLLPEGAAQVASVMRLLGPTAWNMIASYILNLMPQRNAKKEFDIVNAVSLAGARSSGSGRDAWKPQEAGQKATYPGPMVAQSKSAGHAGELRSPGFPLCGTRSQAAWPFSPAVAQSKNAHTARAVPGVVQRLVKTKLGQDRAGLLRNMARLDGRQVPHERLGKDLSKCLEVLEKSAEFHGTIDVNNEQMVALLYFQAVRVNRRYKGGMVWSKALKGPAHLGAKWHDVRQEFEGLLHRAKHLGARIAKLQNRYGLVIIGAGSAAAYYIDTLGVAFDHRFTLLIGGADPWAGQRGEGIDFINHVNQQINYPSEGVRGYSDIFVERKAFANRTRTIIEGAIPLQNRHSGAVMQISQTKSGDYKIEWHDGKKNNETYATKVVIATGAGPHQVTKADVTGLVPEHKKRVMDMDTFIREVIPHSRKNNINGKTVVVQGPNAAIDAVAAAVTLPGWTVSWVVRGSTPVYLPGTRYSLGRIPLFKATEVTITHADTQLEIKAQGTFSRCTAANHQYMSAEELKDKKYWTADPQTLKADYFVYGIGQDIKAAGALLSQDIRDNLEAVQHRGGRYSDVKGSLTWKNTKREGADLNFTNEKHAVGLRHKGGTLEVIGAVAKALANPEQAAMLGAVTKFQSADIVAYEQLGGIRSAMYGLNEHMPPDIAQRVDFSHADPTVLRAHIALKYPNIREEHARRIIGDILGHRKTGHHPHGYDDWWRAHWETNLAWWDRNG
jgi:hypothetical protein